MQTHKHIYTHIHSQEKRVAVNKYYHLPAWKIVQTRLLFGQKSPSFPRLLHSSFFPIHILSLALPSPSLSTLYIFCVFHSPFPILYTALLPISFSSPSSLIPLRLFLSLISYPTLSPTSFFTLFSQCPPFLSPHPLAPLPLSLTGLRWWVMDIYHPFFVPAGSKLNKNSLRSFPLSTRLISSLKLPGKTSLSAI